MTLLRKPTLQPTLLDRIAAMRAEIDKLIDDHVEQIAKATPGVPRQVLRGLLTNRAPGCQCQQAALLLAESKAAA